MNFTLFGEEFGNQHHDTEETNGINLNNPPNKEAQPHRDENIPQQHLWDAAQPPSVGHYGMWGHHPSYQFFAGTYPQNPYYGQQAHGLLDQRDPHCYYQQQGPVPTTVNHFPNPAGCLLDPGLKHDNNDVEKKVRDYNAREMSSRSNSPRAPAPIHRGEPTFPSAFCREIREAPVPKRWRDVSIAKYKGDTDPNDHLNQFTTSVGMNEDNDAMFCRSFPSTLSGVTLAWFTNLARSSINNFVQLSSTFVAHFGSARTRKRTMLDLNSIKQGSSESLGSFFSRFTNMVVQIPKFNQESASTILMGNLAEGDFKICLFQKEPENYDDLRKLVTKQIHAMEAASSSSRPIETKPSFYHKVANKYRGKGGFENQQRNNPPWQYPNAPPRPPQQEVQYNQRTGPSPHSAPTNVMMAHPDQISPPVYGVPPALPQKEVPL